MSDHVRLERAKQLHAAGHDGEAEQIARELLRSEPESVPALILLSLTLVAQDRAKEAMEPAQEACRIDPENVDALLVLSQAASRSGRRELAVETAREAVASAPHDPATHYTLSQALLEGTKDAYPALRAADEAARLAPSWPDVHNMRGLCLAEAGRLTEARAAFQHTLSLDPGHGLALSNLAGLEIRRNPLEAAKKLTMAAGMDPQESVIRENLGAAAHNFVLQLQWLVVGGGLIEGIVASSGGSRAARTIVLALLGLFVLIAAGYFVAQLPRGFRRSPLTLLRSIGDAGQARLLFLGLVFVIVCAIAFGSQESVDVMTGRLMLLAVVGGVVALVRKYRNG